MGRGYCVDLESCITTRAVLSWIVHVSRQTDDGQVVIGLVRALDDIFYFADNGWWKSGQIDVREVRNRIGRLVDTPGV